MAIEFSPSCRVQGNSDPIYSSSRPIRAGSMLCRRFPPMMPCKSCDLSLARSGEDFQLSDIFDALERVDYIFLYELAEFSIEPIHVGVVSDFFLGSSEIQLLDCCFQHERFFPEVL